MRGGGHEVALLTGKGSSLVNGQDVPQGGCTGEATRTLSADVAGAPDLGLVHASPAPETAPRR